MLICLNLNPIPELNYVHTKQLLHKNMHLRLLFQFNDQYKLTQLLEDYPGFWRKKKKSWNLQKELLKNQPKHNFLKQEATDDVVQTNNVPCMLRFQLTMDIALL